MVLHVRDEDDRAQLGGEVTERLDLLGDSEAEHPDHLVDHGGHSGARRDDHVARPGVDVCLDDRVRQVVRMRHQHAGGARFRMRVSDERPDTLQQLSLDRLEEPPARGPVRVHERLAAAGRRDPLVDPNDAAPER